MRMVKIADYLRWRRDYDNLTVYNFVNDDLFQVSLKAEPILKYASSEIEIEELAERASEVANIDKVKIRKFIEVLLQKNILTEV